MDERVVVSCATLIPGDVIGALEDDLPAVVVYRVTPSVVRDGWMVDAVDWRTYERLQLQAWTWDMVARYR